MEGYSHRRRQRRWDYGNYTTKVVSWRTTQVATRAVAIGESSLQSVVGLRRGINLYTRAGKDLQISATSDTPA